MDKDRSEKIALWRLGVLGPLISARLEHGDRVEYYALAAGRVHEHPDGRLVRISPRTVEDWYRTYRKGGFGALFPTDRADLGRSRAIRTELVDIILRAKKERPRRSIRRIIRMLERARLARPGELHRSSVHRLLAALRKAEPGGGGWRRSGKGAQRAPSVVCPVARSAGAPDQFTQSSLSAFSPPCPGGGRAG